MDIELADTLWAIGNAHYVAANALVEQHQRQIIRESLPVGREPSVLLSQDFSDKVFNGPYSASIHLLVGFGFELLLKAAYLLHGGDRDSLGQGGIGHDLKRALNDAESVGFTCSVPHLRTVVERLSHTHQKHHFRYGGPLRVKLPPLEASLPALEGLVEHLKDELDKVFQANGGQN